MKFNLVLCFTWMVSFCYSQGTTVFTGRLVNMDGSKELVQNVSVRLVDVGSGTTNDEGIFKIPIQSSTNNVTLELVNSKMSVVYPIGGKALVPNSTNSVVEFYIGESTKDILTKAIAKSNNDIKNRLKQLGVKQEGIEETLKAFMTEVQMMADIKKSDLMKQIDLDSKREQFYPRLASSITNYINEAKDLKDAFKFVARHAFEDPQALKVLTDAINSYNIVFEELNKEHSGYENTVRELWQSEAKSIQVKELFNYALGELHSANIFTLNLKLKDINEYFRGNIKGSRRTAFKETIIRDIETTELQLDRRLDELDKRTQVVLSELSG